MGYFEVLQLALVCAFAWIKGAKSERAGALVLSAAWILSDALRAWLSFVAPHDLERLKAILSLSGDLMLAIGFLVIAIRYSSLWLGAVLLVQGAEMTLHSMFLGDEPGTLFVYIVISNVFSAILLLMIVAGTCGAWRTRVRRRREQRERAAVQSRYFYPGPSDLSPAA